MEWKGGTGAPGGGGRCAPLPSAFGVEVGDEDGVTVGTTGPCGLGWIAVGHRWAWTACLPTVLFCFFFVEIENEGKEGELMV